jgi:hypothetical protein
MYLRITFSSKNGEPMEILGHISQEDLGDILSKHLPVSSVAEKWKEEIYFSTGIELSGPTTSRIVAGSLAYWPPGKALCLFAGPNQPYGPVIPLGWFLGPKHYVLQIENGSEVKVDVPRDEEYPPDMQKLVKLIRESGYLVAPRNWRNVVSIVGASTKRDTRIGFEIFVEKFGYIIESDPIFKRDFSAIDEALQLRIRAHLIKSRLDINEEGFVILSEYASNENDLIDKLNRLITDYQKVLDVLSLVS